MQRLEPRAGAHVAHPLLDLIDAAELEAGAAPRLRRRDARGDQVVDVHIEMGVQLPREVAIEPVPPKPRS